MKGIGIFPNWQKKDEVQVIIERVVTFFAKNYTRVFVPLSKETPSDTGAETLPLEEFISNVDVVIILGGDGTILRAARELCGKNLPLLGINLGQMGFLAEVEPGVMEEALQKLIDGRYTIKHRLMLSCRVFRNDKKVAEYNALNDIVIGKGIFARIINVNAYVNDKFLETYPSDGMIVSTPTGSTGYNLSAGGPIVNPTLDVMIITPVCPHLLHHRSVIVASGERVQMQVRTRGTDGILTVDGQVSFALQDNDTVQVTRATVTTPLVQIEGSDFYVLLHRKLMKRVQERC